MKKFLIILLLYPIFIQAQIFHVSAVLQEPHALRSDTFEKITFYTTTNDTIKGYANLSRSYNSIRFVKQNKGSDYILKKEWSYYNAKDITRADFFIDDRTFSLYPVKRKADLNQTALYYLLYENGSLKVFCALDSVYDITKPTLGKYSVFYIGILKNGEEKITLTMLNFYKKEKSIPKKMRKFFDDCPELQEKIKKGEYKNTYKDFLSIVDYYDTSCNK